MGSKKNTSTSVVTTSTATADNRVAVTENGLGIGNGGRLTDVGASATLADNGSTIVEQIPAAFLGLVDKLTGYASMSQAQSVAAQTAATNSIERIAANSQTGQSGLVLKQFVPYLIIGGIILLIWRR